VRYWLLLLPAFALAQERPDHSSELIFPLEKWHNHASSIVELPNGELFVCWYHGSGERSADDVIVQAARLTPGAREWAPRFTLADTPGFPDTNPALFFDSKQRLWLWWQAIVANEWHTAITKYRVSSDYLKPGPPRWESADALLVVPRNFAARVKEVYEKYPPSPVRDRVLERASDKYFSRMGWMTRAHPLELPNGRILVPLYSDGYSFSLIAYSDDGGATWQASEPLPGPGNVQPTLVRKRDGTVVAYMRDNGPPPKRIQFSSSRDDGVTWSPVVDTDLPNPGSGLEVIALREGLWAMVSNDLERGRWSLAVALSDDEGATWKWKRHLERDLDQKGSFHYPSILQARDGALHVSYSYFVAGGKSIKHARFSIDWVKAGDPPPPVKPPTVSDIAFGEVGIDYYAPEGPGPHPVAILIHGAGSDKRSSSIAYMADFLTPARYAVFSIDYRLPPKHPYPAMVEDVERAVRYIRYHARKWDADPDRIALVGGSAGGYLANMVAVRRRGAIQGAKDPVDRASARVQAVVSLYSFGDLRGRDPNPAWRELLRTLIEAKGVEAALAEASPVMHITGREPPFLLIHGDRDALVPFAQSTHLQSALKNAGVRCDLIIVPGGGHGTGPWHRLPRVPDWEKEMTEWLNLVFRHSGPVGQGIRRREPQ